MRATHPARNRSSLAHQVRYAHRTRTLVDPAARHGLAARLMDDGERLPHRRPEIRVTALPDHARTVGA